jgi:transposase
MKACERYGSLKHVCEDFKISFDFAYRAFYEQLELKRRKDNQYPWPESIGIDEHGVGRNTEINSRAFVSLIVNHKRKKVMEMVFGRSSGELELRLAHIPGRENVRLATIDMSDPYRKFIREFFPNAQIVADKFHVLRLLSGTLLKERKRVTGRNADRKARGLLLCSSKRLDYFDRLAIWRYLDKYPRLKELYTWKERLHGFYRIKGHFRAKEVLDQLVFEAQLSPEPEIRTLGRTLRSWSTEILNYFAYGLTNARLEGFNNKASLVRRQAYGYRNLNNYRLRVLSVCS